MSPFWDRDNKYQLIEDDSWMRHYRDIKQSLVPTSWWQSISETTQSLLIFARKTSVLSHLSFIAVTYGPDRMIFLHLHPSSSIRGVLGSALRTPGLPVSTPEVLWEPHLPHTVIGLEVSSFNTSVPARHPLLPAPILLIVSEWWRE